MSDLANKTTARGIPAVIFAKEEAQGLERCAIPILGRPVLSYPLMAALHARSVGDVYLSTSSEWLRSIAERYCGVKILCRDQDAEDLIEEFHLAAKTLAGLEAGAPEWMLLLLGNSPCVVSETIENAVALLDQVDDLDGVVSVECRQEFSPKYSSFLDEEGLLREGFPGAAANACYFPNARLILVRTENLLRLRPPFARFAEAFGRRVHPLVQEEGVADIDYAWQVPMCERWLRKEGFTQENVPYPERSPGQVQAVRTSASSDKRKRILVTTVPFGAIDPTPLRLMEAEANCEYVINPIGRKLKERELANMIGDYDILIAGTEPITRTVMDRAGRLQLISRVGIGLDSVDLFAAREKGIRVSYTPDAPAPAVAELTIGHMINLCRRLSLTDRRLRKGVWQRHQGLRLATLSIGLIGTGRVGSRVLRHLQGFGPARILVNDLNPNRSLYDLNHAAHVDKETIYRECDIISLHVPLTPVTNPLIGEEQIALMKPEVLLINTARGDMIDEQVLFRALYEKRIGGAAIDVFGEEPYAGELVTLDNCVLSCHMGSCTRDCRAEMERLATEEALRFVRGEDLIGEVPNSEYDLVARG